MQHYQQQQNNVAAAAAAATAAAEFYEQQMKIQQSKNSDLEQQFRTHVKESKVRSDLMGGLEGIEAIKINLVLKISSKIY